MDWEAEGSGKIRDFVRENGCQPCMGIPRTNDPRVLPL